MKLTVTSLLLAGLVTSATAFAKPAANEKHANWATKVRQANFTLLGHNMGPIGGMLKGKVEFDAQVVKDKATRINELAKMIADTSRVDTSKFKVKTEALANIWTDKADYQQKIDALVTASEKVSQIALTAPKKDVLKAMGKIGQSCGSCHDSYKKD
ncbi:cytochrome c [Catenovulum sp. SM1970]|uniref:c-type cytochrome n=1 Tax=Marinifaba aquimaris TaxID=2741323 RepID=UPI0015740B63|nr:cytochrome c [Marinifaba aquimaris]NTS78368.1 cytochrome c [Marinifaba aquimaris]